MLFLLRIGIPRRDSEPFNCERCEGFAGTPGNLFVYCEELRGDCTGVCPGVLGVMLGGTVKGF